VHPGFLELLLSNANSYRCDCLGVCAPSLELPRLPETLRDILTLSRKASTKKLAGDLYKTINAVW
jgi:hypothetical protein